MVVIESLLSSLPEKGASLLIMADGMLPLKLVFWLSR
jgi:hypothetical protein